MKAMRAEWDLIRFETHVHAGTGARLLAAVEDLQVPAVLRRCGAAVLRRCCAVLRCCGAAVLLCCGAAALLCCATTLLCCAAVWDGR